MLVTDREGSLVRLNEAARLLLPDAATGDPLDWKGPSWLTPLLPGAGDKAPGAARPVTGAVDGRFFEAHHTVDDDGHMVCMDSDSVRVPPLRPGGYDPADYADMVMRSAEEAGVSPRPR